MPKLQLKEWVRVNILKICNNPNFDKLSSFPELYFNIFNQKNIFYQFLSKKMKILLQQWTQPIKIRVVAYIFYNHDAYRSLLSCTFFWSLCRKITRFNIYQTVFVFAFSRYRAKIGDFVKAFTKVWTWNEPIFPIFYYITIFLIPLPLFICLVNVIIHILRLQKPKGDLRCI